ncbi:hypothetical protein DFH28DRAFT_66509 [Melampsora americana]|nr:hypothetical protein DFH28DRAFT_66509 [Melampsora americana]
MVLQRYSPHIQLIEPMESHNGANSTADSLVSPHCDQSKPAQSPPPDSPALAIATFSKHVIFHPTVRIIPADGQSDLDSRSPRSPSRSPKNWSDSKHQRHMRLGTKTLSLPLSLSLHRPHHVNFLSPPASDCSNFFNSRQSVLARTQREIEEDAQFIPAPVRTIKLTFPSLTRRPSSKTLRMQEEERIRRFQEAHGGIIKSCLRKPSLGCGATPANISANNLLQWNQAVENTHVFPSGLDFSPASSSDSVVPKSPLETNEDIESDQSSPDNRSHPVDFPKPPIKGLNRLTKKISDSALHFRFFTPKPHRRQIPDVDREILQDEMEELEVSSPEPELITSKVTSRFWLPVPSLRKPASNIEIRSKFNAQENDSCRPNSTMGDGSSTIDDPMKDRLPVRSSSYHHDSRALPSTSDDPIFNTDPYGETTSSSISMVSPGLRTSKTTFDQTIIAHEQELRPCCATCEDAASKGLQADHEIRFSPRALEIYRSRACYLDDVVIEDAKKVDTGHTIVGKCPTETPRIRTLRCSLHKRDVSFDKSGEIIIPPLPAMPNSSVVKERLPIKQNNNSLASPRPKLYEYHLNQTMSLGVQIESAKV